MNAASWLRSLARPYHNPLILDLLVPLNNPHFQRRQQLATISTSSTPPAPSPPPSSLSQSSLHGVPDASSNLRQQKSLSPSQQSFLDSALRVNQAGELAAMLIYTAQKQPLTRTHPHLAPLMKHMHAQEAGHLVTFNALLAKHRVRPTALRPVWVAAASILGWSTALLGREAAMACTEAVETVIGEHYNGQVRELLSWIAEMKERGEEVDEELMGLVETLKRIRDEELEHLDEALGEGAKDAEGYPVLSGVIKEGCRRAIWLSERL